jgi:hypothetical protein
MKRPGFGAMKAFLALSSSARDKHTDWLRVVAVWSTVVTAIVIVLYFLQRGH